MIHRFRKIKEPYRMFLIGAMTVAVLVVVKAWPVVESAIWTAFLGFLAALLYFDLREPVNYISLKFDSNGFRHEGHGGVSDVAWSDVFDVFYVRDFEPFANQIETEWHFVLKTGECIVVLVEWPHRRPFARAIAANLDFVSKDLVAKAHRMRGEGRWRCIDE